nr:hypothetical protein [uncultured Olsenella sp.]
MSEFHLAEQGVFGRYCKIEMYRHISQNEFYVHKCIGNYESNVWVDVPIHGNPKPRLHKKMAPVMDVITCGIDESHVFRVRMCDVEMLPPEERTCHDVADRGASDFRALRPEWLAHHAPDTASSLADEMVVIADEADMEDVARDELRSIARRLRVLGGDAS